jgi:hypothetical protein
LGFQVFWRFKLFVSCSGSTWEQFGKVLSTGSDCQSSSSKQSSAKSTKGPTKREIEIADIVNNSITSESFVNLVKYYQLVLIAKVHRQCLPIDHCLCDRPF